MRREDNATSVGRTITRHIEAELKKILFERVDTDLLLKVGRDAVKKARGLVESRVEVKYTDDGPEIHVWFRPRGSEEWRWLRALTRRSSE